MVSVPDLRSASPRAWRDAADDALSAAKHCEEIGTFAREDVARTIEKQWVSDAGLAARRTFVKHAEDYEAAHLALRELCRVYDDLADEIEAAQRDLNSALGYAKDHELTVDDSGRVAHSKPVASGKGDDSQSEPVRHAQGIIEGALSRATKADTTASAALRTIRGLTEISDPKLVKEALKKNSPLAIALRLTGAPDGPHPINVSPAQLAAVERAARETGMSKTLLLSILWQEQQWYQNYDKDGRGLLPSIGRMFNWTLQQTIKPDKSLGITHMKLGTARKVMADNRDVFTAADGTYLGDLSDAQLTKYIEENPNEDIRLSAYYLQQLQKNPYGSDTDKQLFVLYAADTPDVREKNEQYGDDSDHRGGDIKTRGENWDKLQPRLEDAKAWEALSDEEREKALAQLEGATPKGHSFTIDPIYGGDTPGTGTGEPEPGTPSPEPGKSPTPPSSGGNDDDGGGGGGGDKKPTEPSPGLTPRPSATG
ncbi:hypothetical protein JK364_10090 [Streptomyces sp. 110]|uniref:Uncharacterized protein n=1 Tax=Streptomyces endocoffeicus TaxID=2898945 RepID=A0ABS1PK02_9ACTN|nr:hypothetical protein [Streptomyces endocoffeicus]MBL1112745.1 hypothetical protein [Streptomyces endocoffeicus]